MKKTTLSLTALEATSDLNWHDKQVPVTVMDQDPQFEPLLFANNPKKLLLTAPFVDFHLHLNQHGQEGQTAGKTLLPWLEQVIFPYETLQKNNPTQAKKIAENFLENCRRWGTHTIVALCGISEHERAYWLELMSSPRYQLNLCLPTPVVMDRLIPEGLSTLPSELNHFLESFKLNPKNELSLPILWGLCLRFLPSTSAPLLETISLWAQENRQHWFTTHFSENDAEVQLVGELFGNDLSYTAHLAKLGLLHEKTILAHGIHVNDSDLNIMKKNNIILAHCPTSNQELKSGRCPIEKYLEKNIDWGLGCDIGAGPTINFLDVIHCFEQIHQSALKQYGMSSEQISSMAFYRATQGGLNLLAQRDHRVNKLIQAPHWTQYLIWDHPDFKEHHNSKEKWRILLNERDRDQTHIIGFVKGNTVCAL